MNELFVPETFDGGYNRIKEFQIRFKQEKREGLTQYAKSWARGRPASKHDLQVYERQMQAIYNLRGFLLSLVVKNCQWNYKFIQNSSPMFCLLYAIKEKHLKVLAFRIFCLQYILGS